MLSARDLLSEQLRKGIQTEVINLQAEISHLAHKLGKNKTLPHWRQNGVAGERQTTFLFTSL